MSPPRPDSVKKAEEHAARLAAALRDNLKRRKDQAKSRTDGQAKKDKLS